ncbi:ceramidase domain-containing protein [Roseovarius sp. D0-M9]|uniref:ceramidase domain-containing protein n=1 Tax=Roseovarius sp. D0-M9 TaxID=3127117 RepID=UPI00300FCE37
MDWTRQIDGYCERMGTGLWAEPVNAATNLAFLLAAVVMARRLHVAGREGADLRLAWLLVLCLAMIGIGSLLFHTAAQVWAALLDVVPIGAFTLVYLYAAHRAFFGWGRAVSLLGALAFIPFAMAVSALFAPLIGGSAAYAALPLAIFGYGAALSARAPRTASGLVAGGVLLSLSITARALDAPLCGVWPLGTHFLWHLLNALMLAWMIEVYTRHMLAREGAGR